MKRRQLVWMYLCCAVVIAALIPGVDRGWAQQVPGGTPDYFNKPNWTNSPPLRKFVDTLPGLGSGSQNNLGQYIPVANPDTSTFAGEDYYEIGLKDYYVQMHSDMPPTKLRGYYQINNGTTGATDHTNNYLGPLIIAQKDRVVRVKFVNELATGTAGNLFIPVDTSVMGAGAFEVNYDPASTATPTTPSITGMFAQNRATLHLHGGRTPWISDGTPHQWITPAGENTPYPKGVSVQNVPDMWYDSNTLMSNGTYTIIPGCAGQLVCGDAGATNDSGPGSQTFYWTNQQSGRLMFYHDHAWGITRLNVYAGEAAGYLITDMTETTLQTSGAIPPMADTIPLIIQDKTFVDETTIGANDPTWNWGTTPPIPHTGDLWWPHVYMPAQNPYNPDMSGVNPMGRWHYGPWFWPPTSGIAHNTISNPMYDPDCDPATIAPGLFCQPPEIPGTPNPSWVAEAFLDTPVINGTAYPKLNLAPQKYRFRILNAAHDRFFNLQFYVADSSVPVPADCPTCATNTEIKMVPAAKTTGFPDLWPADDRAGGVPDPATSGPAWIQIGTEGGFLPQPVLLNNQPIQWNLDPTMFNVGNILPLADGGGTLMLGPAERADVIVDFTNFAGKTLILYNDGAAAWPALDPHYDYYTGVVDNTSMGGSPGTPVGRGPNTRTLMQIVVSGTGGTAPPNDYDTAALSNLTTAFTSTTGVFATGQEPVIVGQTAYDANYNMTFPTTWPNWGVSRISDSTLSFKQPDGTLVSSYPMLAKAIQDEMGEVFDDYGRMSAKLGLEQAFTNTGIKTFIVQNYVDKPTEIVSEDEIQIWKVSHNGVDTHPIHFHLFEVQIINRVGWDGFIRLPDANELGWKDTVKFSPLEDTIVALRPAAPSVPFPQPDSIRPLNPSEPLGSMMGFSQWDPYTGNQMVPPQENELYNFGAEYVWHCHILSHEENDMMRSIVFLSPLAAPLAPTGLTADATLASQVTLTWQDNATDELGFRVERDPGGGFATLVKLSSSATPTGVITYVDTDVAPGATYDYRVYAYNARGDSTASNVATANMTMWAAATGLTLTTSSPSPHQAGTVAVFEAVATGTTTTYQYKFSLTSGVVTTVTRNWATGNTWTLPATTLPGTYTITAEVRTNFTSAVPDQTAQVTNYVLRWPDAVSVSLTSSLTSSQGAGTPVTFTAAGFGSTGYEYQFSLYSVASGTSIVQPWSTTAAWTMAGTTLADTYRVTVECRSNTVQIPVIKSVNFTISNYLLTGTVKTTGGVAVSGALVTLNTAPTKTALSDALGAFSLTSVPSGTYTAAATLTGQTIDIAPAYAAGINVNANLNDINFTLRTYTISGVVTNGTASMVGVAIALTSGGTATSVTDIAGSYTLTDLMNGAYTVTPTLADQTLTPVNAPVTVLDANMTANFTVNPLAVTVAIVGGGVMDPPTTQLVTYNTTTSFLATPNIGNVIVSVNGCGGTGILSSSTATTYTTGAIVSACTVTATFTSSTWQITATVSTPTGTVTPPGLTGLLFGDSLAYTITPDVGYHVTDVLVDLVSAGAVTSYNFTNVQANHTIDASFAINTYSLSASAGTNGSISPLLDAQIVSYGTVTTFTVTPDTGYHIVTVDGCGGNLTANTYSVPAITSNCSVTAAFAINTYALNYTAGANGLISGTPNQTINHFASASTVTAVPLTGYHFVNWTGTGGFVTATTNPLTVSNVSAAMDITANFAIDTFAVNFASGGNGSVTGTTSQTVNYGSAATAVTAVPSTGYHFVNWTGTGGFAATSANPLTVSNVTAAMDITANFAIDTITVSFAAGANGMLTGDTSQPLNYGADATAVTAVPSSGYRFVNWTGTNGFVTTTSNPLTVAGATASYTITASFELDTLTLTFVSGGNGSLTGSASQVINRGAYSSEVTAVPDAHYHFVNWTGTGGFAATAANPLTLVNVTADQTITANFAIDAFDITLSIGTNGSVNPAASQTVSYGSTMAFTVTPDTGFITSSVAGCGGSLSGSTYTTGPVTAACTVTASFIRPDGDLGSGGTVADALQALLFTTGVAQPTAAQLQHGDVAPLVSGKPAPDGKIDIADVVVILRRSLGLVTW